MTTQERAAKVLQEIDAALALAEKATPEFVMPTGYVGLNNKGEHYRAGWHHGASAYSEHCTLLPTSLRCLKTAIEGLLYTITMESNANDAQTMLLTTSQRSLTTLCDQWNQNDPH